jgi:hypothetical protein
MPAANINPFNVQNFGRQTMTDKEYLRHCLQVIQMLNRADGERIVSREAALLFGLDVKTFSTNVLAKHRFHANNPKMLDRNLFELAHVQRLFSSYKPRGHRLNYYTGQRLDSKKNIAVMQIIAENLF